MLRLSYVLDRDVRRIVDTTKKLKGKDFFGRMQWKERAGQSGGGKASKTADTTLGSMDIPDEEWANFLCDSTTAVLGSSSETSFFDEPTYTCSGLVLQIEIENVLEKRPYKARQFAEKQEYALQKQREICREMQQHLNNVAPAIHALGAKSDAGYERIRAMMGYRQVGRGKKAVKVRLGTSTGRKDSLAAPMFPVKKKMKQIGALQLKEIGIDPARTRGIRLADNSGTGEVGAERAEFCSMDLQNGANDVKIIGVLRDLRDWVSIELTLAHEATGSGSFGELNVDISDPAMCAADHGITLVWWCDGHPSSHHDLGRISFWMHSNTLSE